jgi:hypothetical protein
LSPDCQWGFGAKSVRETVFWKITAQPRLIGIQAFADGFGQNAGREGLVQEGDAFGAGLIQHHRFGTDDELAAIGSE